MDDDARVNVTLRMRPSTMMLLDKQAAAERRSRADYMRLLIAEGIERRAGAGRLKE